MSDQSLTVIPLSKSKLLRLLFLSLGFVALGIWLALVKPANVNLLLINPVTDLAIGVLIILLGIVMGILAVQKITDPRPGLIIDSKGFTDNSSGIGAGFIPWSEVQSIKAVKVSRQNILVVVLKDPEAYIRNEPKTLRRKAKEANYRTYGGPVQLSVTSLQCTFDDLVQLFETRLGAKANP